MNCRKRSCPCKLHGCPKLKANRLSSNYNTPMSWHSYLTDSDTYYDAKDTFDHPDCSSLACPTSPTPSKLNESNSLTKLLQKIRDPRQFRLALQTIVDTAENLLTAFDCVIKGSTEKCKASLTNILTPKVLTPERRTSDVLNSKYETNKQVEWKDQVDDMNGLQPMSQVDHSAKVDRMDRMDWVDHMNPMHKTDHVGETDAKQINVEPITVNVPVTFYFKYGDVQLIESVHGGKSATEPVKPIHTETALYKPASEQRKARMPEPIKDFFPEIVPELEDLSKTDNDVGLVPPEELPLPQQKDLNLSAPYTSNDCPIFNANQAIVCPNNCGCCSCPCKENIEIYLRVSRSKIKICPSAESKNQCSPNSDICTRRDVAESRYVELCGTDMYADAVLSKDRCGETENDRDRDHSNLSNQPNIEAYAGLRRQPADIEQKQQIAEDDDADDDDNNSDDDNNGDNKWNETSSRDQYFTPRGSCLGSYEEDGQQATKPDSTAKVPLSTKFHTPEGSFTNIRAEVDECPYEGKQVTPTKDEKITQKSNLILRIPFMEEYHMPSAAISCQEKEEQLQKVEPKPFQCSRDNLCPYGDNGFDVYQQEEELRKVVPKPFQWSSISYQLKEEELQKVAPQPFQCSRDNLWTYGDNGFDVYQQEEEPREVVPKPFQWSSISYQLKEEELQKVAPKPFQCSRDNLWTYGDNAFDVYQEEEELQEVKLKLFRCSSISCQQNEEELQKVAPKPFHSSSERDNLCPCGDDDCDIYRQEKELQKVVPEPSLRSEQLQQYFQLSHEDLGNYFEKKSSPIKPSLTVAESYSFQKLISKPSLRSKQLQQHLQSTHEDLENYVENENSSVKPNLTVAQSYSLPVLTYRSRESTEDKVIPLLEGIYAVLKCIREDHLHSHQPAADKFELPKEIEMEEAFYDLPTPQPSQPPTPPLTPITQQTHIASAPPFDAFNTPMQQDNAVPFHKSSDWLYTSTPQFIDTSMDVMEPPVRDEGFEVKTQRLIPVDMDLLRNDEDFDWKPNVTVEAECSTSHRESGICQEIQENFESEECPWANKEQKACSEACSKQKGVELKTSSNESSYLSESDSGESLICIETYYDTFQFSQHSLASKVANEEKTSPSAQNLVPDNQTEGSTLEETPNKSRDISYESITPHVFPNVPPLENMLTNDSLTSTVTKSDVGTDRPEFDYDDETSCFTPCPRCHRETARQNKEMNNFIDSILCDLKIIKDEHENPCRVPRSITTWQKPAIDLSYPVTIEKVQELGANSLFVKWKVHSIANIVGYEIFLDGHLTNRYYNHIHRAVVICQVNLQLPHRIIVRAEPPSQTKSSSSNYKSKFIESPSKHTFTPTTANLEGSYQQPDGSVWYPSVYYFEPNFSSASAFMNNSDCYANKC